MTAMPAIEMLDLDVTDTLVPEIGEVRDLTQDDLQALASNGVAHSSALVERISAEHHLLARMVAADMKEGAIARRTGYSGVTISQLKNSPAFIELVSHYKENLKEDAFELESQAHVTTSRLLYELDDRLADDATRKAIPLPTLLDATVKMLDRSGVGPVKRVESKNLNVNLSGESAREIREEARKLRFRDAEVLEATPSGDRGTGVGEADPARTLAPGAPSGNPGEGPGV